MIKRCYSEKYQEKWPTYIGCYVCEPWKRFSIFAEWMADQDHEGKALDKDILVRGNREYAPDKCVFVDANVNGFILERQNDRGEWPIGVSFAIEEKGLRHLAAK